MYQLTRTPGQGVGWSHITNDYGPVRTLNEATVPKDIAVEKVIAMVI